MAYTPTKTHKWIIAIVAIIALLIAAYFVFKSISASNAPAPVTPGTTTTTQPGLWGLGTSAWSAITNFFSGGPKPATSGSVPCDPNNKGYNIDGVADSACGKDFTNCTVGKCDPKSPGFDECGFPDMNCE